MSGPFPFKKEKISDGAKLSGDRELEPKLLFGMTMVTMCIREDDSMQRAGSAGRMLRAASLSLSCL